MKRILFILALALVTGARAADKLEVVATLPDLGAVVAEVGGSAVHVSTLAQPSEDPHFVDPKPSFAKVLNKANLLVEGGAELELGWLPPLIQNARNQRILPGQMGRFAAAEGVDVKERPSGPVDRSQGDVHPSGNPHYLMDPVNGPVMGRNVAERLAKLQPADAEMFRQNAAAFQKDVASHLDQWSKALASLKGAKVITYHRSFNYFLDRFGLELFDTIEPKPGIEPSPTHITGLINRAKGAGIKLIIIEENRPRKTAERVAKEIGARLVLLRHMPDSSAPGRYIAWINDMVQAVEKASQ